MNLPITVTCAICSAALLGCAQPRPYGPPPPSTPAIDPIPREMQPNVVVEPDIERLLLRGEPTVARGEHSRNLAVTVPLRTVLDEEFAIEYRFVFLSPTGAEENARAPWRPLTLPARSQRVLEGRSIRSNTADWRLEIRALR